MIIPLKVVDRGRLVPADLRQKLQLRTQKLAHFCDGLEECRLIVDGPGQHPLSERVRVRLYLSVAGTEIAVSHQSGESLSIALRSAFGAANRKLKAHARLARKGGRDSGRGSKIGSR